MMRTFAILAVIAAQPVSAGTIALSALATKPRIDHHATVPKAAKLTIDRNYLSIVAPYCFVTDLQPQTAGEDDLDSDRRGGWADLDSASLWIERLAIDEHGAELERTKAVVVDGKVTATERQHIPLHEVGAIDAHHSVWAYRAGNHVFVIAEAVGATFVRFDSAEPTSGRGVTRDDECGYAITQLTIGPHSSQAAQISGTLDSDPYLVDVSLTKTARDPEAILSVAARVTNAP